MTPTSKNTTVARGAKTRAEIVEPRRCGSVTCVEDRNMPERRSAGASRSVVVSSHVSIQIQWNKPTTIPISNPLCRSPVRLRPPSRLRLPTASHRPPRRLPRHLTPPPPPSPAQNVWRWGCRPAIRGGADRGIGLHGQSQALPASSHPRAQGACTLLGFPVWRSGVWGFHRCDGLSVDRCIVW